MQGWLIRDTAQWPQPAVMFVLSLLWKIAQTHQQDQRLPRPVQYPRPKSICEAAQMQRGGEMGRGQEPGRLGPWGPGTSGRQQGQGVVFRAGCSSSKLRAASEAP